MTGGGGGRTLLFLFIVSVVTLSYAMLVFERPIGPAPAKPARAHAFLSNTAFSAAGRRGGAGRSARVGRCAGGLRRAVGPGAGAGW